MSTSEDADPEALISRLAGPLSPPAREAFRRAAEDALARVPCWGEGAIYRAVAHLQRDYFDPPSFHSPRSPRSSKLASGPPIWRGREVSNRRFKFPG
jgi:hypothetical protein